MSFDVFFQGFIGGEGSGSGGDEMRRVLAPHVKEQKGSFLRIQVGDGQADIYLSGDGMMANHVSGRDTWDLLVKGAQEANWVILPLDGPTCLTGMGQREQLPEGMDGDVVVVDSGASLLAILESL